VKAELQQLIALQNLDTSIRRLERELETIPQRRAEIENEFDQRASDIRAVENRRNESRQTRARLEAETVEQRGRAERAERNLMSSKKQDEYTAAIREADAARKQISTIETQILEQMEIFEQAETSLKERAQEIASLNSDREERLKAFDDETRSRTELLAANRAEREKLFNSLSKPISSLYNRISARIRDGIAVAEARNGSCTACFMALRPQVMAEVRRGAEVITCDNCSRILYYAGDASATSPASAQPKLVTT
jgi:predicted  nucleic acid-binding Zn-ribbon protein